MMTVHVLSGGDGYTYYTNEVATGDTTRAPGSEIGDYYTAEGNPAGVWMGAGREHLGVEGEVTEAQMLALYGEGLHPNADAMIEAAAAQGLSKAEALRSVKLGRRSYRYSVDEGQFPKQLREATRAFEVLEGRDATREELAEIRADVGRRSFEDAKGREPSSPEELAAYTAAASKPQNTAVAGFDLTFSPPKSVSVLWALGDTETRKAIEDAQTAAVENALRYVEGEAVATRTGANGVAQIDVQGGVVASRFRHYDSRNGDPQIHDHVVVANRVLGTDGKWRTLDSKLLHRQGVAASEFYNQAVMTEVAQRLGVAVEPREVTPGKRPVMEVAGVDARLMDGFSSRSRDIRETVRGLEKEYRKTHGRAPDAKARLALAQQATLQTRASKRGPRSLAELRKSWREAATQNVGAEAVEGVLSAAQAAAAANTRPVEPVNIDAAASEVVATISEQRSVWGPHHVEAEARRYVMREVGADAPERLAEQIAARAIERDSVALTPPNPYEHFQPLARESGESIYRHKGTEQFTSQAVMGAEAELLDAAELHMSAPVSAETFAETAEQFPQLDAGQRRLAEAFATDDRALIVGIGPAGAGKTTAMKAAARAVEADGHRLVGLAPSAVAAGGFAEAVGVEAHTLHAFVGAHRRGNVPEAMQLRAGDVLVVDEAGMAGTLLLAEASRIAQDRGANVRLLGDARQLQAVEAGGALRLLERERGAVALDELHRFSSPEEAQASLSLRDPEQGTDPFKWYRGEGRVVGGDSDQIKDLAFTAWQRDLADGRDSVVLAHTNEEVRDLNNRAQAHAMLAGKVTGKKSAQLSDEARAYKGDQVVTRENMGHLKTTNGDPVRNGHVWTVRVVHDDGALLVQSPERGRITLPAEYVSQHTELGYASTLNRAQGITVDTSHVLAGPSTERSAAYVGLTRGRHENRLYVETETGQGVDDVLETIAGNHDTHYSAHEAMRAEQDRAENIVSLAEQYGDAAQRADAVRFDALARDVLPEAQAQALVEQESWGAVRAALSKQERDGLDPRDVLIVAANARELGSADDAGAVLAWRIQQDSTRYEVMSYQELPDVDAIRLVQHRDWKAVVSTLRNEEDNGRDPRAALRTARDAREMNTSRDPGAVLAHRIQDRAKKQQEAATRREALQRQSKDSARSTADALRRQLRADRTTEQQRTAAALRSERPAATATAAAASLTVPAWVIDRTAERSSELSQEWRDQLAQRGEHIEQRWQERGDQLAATPPQWANELGPVPSDPAARVQWQQLATEVSVYREKYGVREESGAAIPANHQDKPVAAELQERVTKGRESGHAPTQAQRSPQQAQPQRAPAQQRDLGQER